MITLECSYLDFTESILINNIGASKWIDCLREIYLFQHLPDYKLMEIAFGIKKIIMTLIIDDDKISIDELIEEIESWENEIQSVDILSFKEL